MSEFNTEPNQVDTEVETSDQPEAPVATEPAPVEVSPADQSDVRSDNVLGKDYEVSAERGYRVKQD